MADKYPYVEIRQITWRQWSAELITRDIDRVMYSNYRIRYARNEASARRKGSKLIAKYKKKYGDLADPYRIR